MEKSGQLSLDKMDVHKMVQKKKYEDRQSVTTDARMQGNRQIETFFDNLDRCMSLDEFMIRSTKVRGSSFYECRHFFSISN